MTQERRILLGRVLGAFGVRGELKLHSFTDPVSTAMKYQPWILVHKGSERELSGSARPRDQQGHGRSPSRASTTAMPPKPWRGAEIWVPRGHLPKPKPGEYYWVDLEGMRVVNREGVEFGTVSHLFETGANDVMVVQRRSRTPDSLHRPEQFIARRRFRCRRITVDWDADF